MAAVTEDELKTVLDLHKRWVKGLVGGVRANLAHRDLGGVNLAKANLAEASFAGASMAASNFAGANLAGADLFACDLSSTDLRRALLSRADLRGTKLGGAKIDGADLQDAALSDGVMITVSRRGELTFSRGDGADMQLADASLQGANLSGAVAAEGKAVVVGEFVRRRRGPGPRKIGGARAQHPPPFADLARNETGIAQPPNADGDIELALDQIGHPVACREDDVNRRVTGVERRERRGEVEAGQACRRRQPQDSARRAADYAREAAEAATRPTVIAPSFALPGLHVWGTYAQYIEAPARAVVRDTTGLSPEEAATLPVVLATAVHAAKGVGGITAGDNVLVHAGASGSGSMLIQVAKALGARVTTTVRDRAKGGFAKAAGADLVIDSRSEDVVARVMAWTEGRGADVAIDNLGGAVLAKSIEAVKPQGVVVAYGFAADPEVRFGIRSLFFAQKQIRGSMASDIEDLEWGLAQVKAGKIKPLLDRALPLEQAAEAHRLISENAVKGNLVSYPGPPRSVQPRPM